MTFHAVLNACNSNFHLACRAELPRVLSIVLGLFLVLANAPETYGDCTSSQTGRCVVGPVEYIAKPDETAAKYTAKKMEKAAQYTSETIEMAGRDTGLMLALATNESRKSSQTAGQGTEDPSDYVARYVDGDSVSGYGDTVEAFEVAGRFVERQISNTGRPDSDAEKRIREDKVIDAFWHLGANDFTYSVGNAAKTAQENSLINTTEQVSASVDAGPAGVAAHAAWYTFQATGDFEMALRVGIIVGAKGLTNSTVESMPLEKLARKALISGAIGGVAVAASGGDENTLAEGFLNSGGMVLVQDGFKEYTENDPGTQESTDNAFCMLAIPEMSVDPSQPTACLPPVDAYARDVDGNVLDEDGAPWSSKSGKSPDIDVRNTENLRNRLRNLSDRKGNNWIHERGSFMATVSKGSRMNTMAGFNDHWALSWNMSALSNKVPVVPAVVITYMGTTAPLEKLVIDQTVKRQHEQNVYLSSIPDGSILDNSDSLAVAKQLKLRGIDGVKGNGDVRVAEHSCENGDAYRRNIVVDKGGKRTDYACRVIYDSEKGLSVLWRAKNDSDYCGPKADSLLNKLVSWGWSCVSRELRAGGGLSVTTYSKNPFVSEIKLSDVQTEKEPDVHSARKQDQQRSRSSMYKCSQNRFVRTIYVEHGNSNEAFACRVAYQSENETSVLWTAKKDWNNCGPIAVSLARKFEDYGWSCS